MTKFIRYQIRPTYPEKHLFDVSCIIEHPNPTGQKLALPAWIPGSYLIRDFSRHLITLKAESEGKSLSVEMLDKNTWQCSPTPGPLVVTYQVYAFDLTPRGAYVDNTQAFFNGSRVFLQVIGFEELPCRVEILAPTNTRYQKWRVATSLDRAQSTEPYQFGEYQAKQYEDLIDHPVQIGDFSTTNFQAAGILHELVIIGNHRGDITRLCKDLSRICEKHIHFFAEPLPMKRYLFLLTVLGDGYGGLEHRFSSALQCRRDALPKAGELAVSEHYRSLLGLFSHEYFHAWHVKRIKPAAFSPYHLEQENYTRQLWIFEGITSYYDELALVRSEVISKDSYLELLGQSITRVYTTPGRLKQTLAQSSFEAWTKFYKPDENSPNATISYYTKGALVALALDLSLRLKTQNQCSLDKVMKSLWQRYGVTNQGVPEGAFEALVTELSSCDFTAFFDQMIRSTEDLDLSPLFIYMGIDLQFKKALSMEDYGGRRTQESSETQEKEPTKPLLEIKLKSFGNDAQVALVVDGSSAQMAGLAPYDVIVAINGLKTDRARFETMISQYSIGEEVTLHAFRRDELMTFHVKLRGPSLQTATLSFSPLMTETQKQNLQTWLSG